MQNTLDSFAPGADYYGGRTAYSGEFFEKLAHALNLNTNSTVLDLACGSGELSLGLSRFAGTIVGTDKSNAMLKNVSSETQPNVSFLQHDLNEAPFSTGKKFDVVTIGRAIPYIDISKLKDTLSLSLKSGGSVIICGAGMGPETAWLGSYQQIRRQFTQKKSRLDFRGMRAMKAINFSYVRTINNAIRVNFSFDEIVNHALSFPTQTETILQDIEQFRAALAQALAPFKSPEGTFAGSEHSWGNIFQSRGS